MFSGMKPLPKLIIILIFVGLVVFAGNFAFNKFGGAEKVINQAANKPTATSSTMTAATTSSGSTGGGWSSAPSKSDALNVSIVSFHGYAPALVANGNSLTTQPGSIYDKLGAKVNFIVQDDIPTLTTLFEAGTASCAWRTSDFWAQEQPNLRNGKLDARAVMVVDNTQGGDAVIARDPSIKSIEDLAGKTVALLQFTPSHGMLIDAINNSSLSAKKKASIKFVFINADEGTSGVRAAFESGKVDAAVLWDPDLSLAARNAHVVYSTKTATNLIFDIMVCDSKVLNSADGKAKVQKFVQGWMEGVKAARADKDNAVTALVKTEDLFKVLADKEGRPFIKGLFDNVVWTGLEDNARILGLTAGGTNHYERVYGQFDQIYRSLGALANPNSPVIAPQDSFDYSFIKTLLDKDAGAQAAADKPQTTFSDAGLATASKKATQVTKPVLVKFPSGSADLNKAAMATIDKEMVPFIENNGSAYIEISGNTDSTGSASVNKPLSLQRAQVVIDYLVKQWDMDKSRFKAVGNGSDHMICNEANPSGDDMSLDECRATNRTTRVGVFGK